MSKIPITLTDRTFAQEVLTSSQPVLVDFWAPWCGPCRIVGPVVAQIAREYSDRVQVGKLNIDDYEVLPNQYGISAIPALLIFKNGRVVDRIIGAASKAAIAQRLDAVLSDRELAA